MKEEGRNRENEKAEEEEINLGRRSTKEEEGKPEENRVDREEGSNQGSEEMKESKRKPGEDKKGEEEPDQEGEKPKEEGRDPEDETIEEEEEGGENHGEPKAEESSLGDVIIQDENEGGGETARNEGLHRVPVRRGRDRYGSKLRQTLHAAAREILHSSTHARQRGDVTEKNDGPKNMISRLVRREAHVGIVSAED